MYITSRTEAQIYIADSAPPALSPLAAAQLPRLAVSAWSASREQTGSDST